MRLLLPLCLFSLACTAVARGAAGVDLTAGPMVGHVTDHSARIWMQFPVAGEVTITTYDAQQNFQVSELRVDLTGPLPFTCDVPINNLQPNHTYRIAVKLDGDPVRLPPPELAIRTAPTPGEEAAFTIAFGSNIAFSPLLPAN